MNVCKFCGFDQADILLHESQCEKRPRTVSSKNRLTEMRDRMRNESLKTEQCYTCYTDLAKYVADELDKVLADEVPVHIAHRCEHGNESVLCIPCHRAEIKRLHGLMHGLEDQIRHLQHERDSHETSNEVAALRRVIERHARWRETALGFLKQVIDGRGTEDEWPALAEFVERSESRISEASSEKARANAHCDACGQDYVALEGHRCPAYAENGSDNA